MFKESEDFYIKINDGEVVTENKTGNIDFINENTNSKQVDAVPDYTSPEYVEYISKINRDSLREINSEDINNIETVSNIRKEIKEKNDTIDIPEVSTFLIEDGKLTLLDNYLYEYYDKDIILK